MEGDLMAAVFKPAEGAPSFDGQPDSYKNIFGFAASCDTFTPLCSPSSVVRCLGCPGQ
jgi:hypothetical protein